MFIGSDEVRIQNVAVAQRAAVLHGSPAETQNTYSSSTSRRVAETTMRG